MPIIFPKSKPAAIPIGIGKSKCVNVLAESDTPALANANNGKIAKATQGCNACSKVCNDDFNFGSEFFAGINSARITPEMVACIPDFRMQSHKKNPMIKNKIIFL